MAKILVDGELTMNYRQIGDDMVELPNNQRVLLFAFEPDAVNTIAPFARTLAMKIDLGIEEAKQWNSDMIAKIKSRLSNF